MSFARFRGVISPFVFFPFRLSVLSVATASGRCLAIQGAPSIRQLSCVSFYRSETSPGGYSGQGHKYNAGSHTDYWKHCTTCFRFTPVMKIHHPNDEVCSP